ncbi:probable N-acetyltransferase 16 [Branchiostoma lanceolatum]|uniref:probable N-acetyltransferase 16 n=1 Tax=Branchiostoma lanceolatum TaxID=7740 RepID=UPI0034547FCF
MGDGGLTVREAKHDDYEAVMKMARPDTFRDGFDYLPARFHQYVDDPDVFIIMAESGDSLVGMFLYMFHDDGEALLGKTGRQNPKYDDGGAFRRVSQSIPMVFKDFLLQRCKPTTLYQSVVEGHRTNLRKYLQYFGLRGKDKCKFHAMYFQSDVSAIQCSLASSNTTYLLPLITPYQPPDLHRLLPPAFSAAVLVEDRLFVDWEPYKLSQSNMKKFVEAGCYILVDPTEPAAKSLSFGGSYMTPRGRVYHIDIHCKDEALCKAHIINHVKNACSHYRGMITFCIMVIDQALKETVVKYCVENLTLSHLPHDHIYTLYETDLTTMANAALRKKAKY